MPAGGGKRKISRRQFLKGMGGSLVGGALLPSAISSCNRNLPSLSREVEKFEGQVSFSLNINGKTHKVVAPPNTTLLEVLREQLHFTGSKPVCDRGDCGACTVLVDGEPMLACSLLAIDMRGRKITTVEGLGSENNLSPIQKAFAEKDGMMCGFCTPGFVVMATAFLQKNPHPTLEQVKKGLSGNLCRCGAYPKIFESVLAAADYLAQRRK